jgi:hypothetical protein
VNFLIATATFVDPSDGQMIYAGRTFVSAGSDVARSHRQNFKPATRRGSPFRRLLGPRQDEATTAFRKGRGAAAPRGYTAHSAASACRRRQAGCFLDLALE